MLKELLKEENRLFEEDGEDQYCFIEDDRNLEKNWYCAAGLVCGMFLYFLKLILVPQQSCIY